MQLSWLLVIQFLFSFINLTLQSKKKFAQIELLEAKIIV
jgi:hypothetical protein